MTTVAVHVDSKAELTTLLEQWEKEHGSGQDMVPILTRYDQLSVFSFKGNLGISRWSSGYYSGLSLPGAQAQHLIGELRSCKLCNVAKKETLESSVEHYHFVNS